ncbi:MAG: hypothetical protein GY710_06815 [Desulfobacteraceae bacterium]|nr:hypothetical protein [Desulfobacteraceae bacterium]
MEKEFKQVKESLNRLDSLYKNHMESFDNKELPNLEKQSSDRAIEVDKLMKKVGKLIDSVQAQANADTKSMIIALNDRVTILLEQNKVLKKKVDASREDIKKNMKHIAKGKKVINSYKSSGSVSNKPKVLNITN